MKPLVSFAAYAAIVPFVRAAGFNLLHNWQGSTFFDDDWSYYGSWDNLTLGDVNFVTRDVAFAQPQLTYVNAAGNAIVRVDNVSTVPQPYKRNAVRISSVETYGLGSLWVMDALHLPYGCSVWPAFWSQATKWPEGGQIDTLEQINMASSNQYALHTVDGCMASTSAPMSGILTDPDCGTEEPYKTQGCTVTEPNQASYGAAFAAGGGGVYATLLADSGVFIWFFPRANIPSDLSVSNPDSSPNPDSWGTPSASYPSSTCPTSTYFEPQHVIIDITLCGAWGGVPSTLNATCPGVPAGAPSNYCYTTYVAGDGSHYATAYFEIQYVRVWSNVTSASGGNSTSGSDASSSNISSTPSQSTTGSNPTTSGNSSSPGPSVSSRRGSALPIRTQRAALGALFGLIVAVVLLA
ncbi:glycoside hydrolase family 16 protein [Calocera viscosa TUFC12733]|uniref:Glycoside hydrolase family 16 protein n=1 Tax=Calocera viscosa (strain TUFC12733) TaxID=1330018 RepID=A0A167K5I0_CALVF|nr:glycoside hydrolase family 16 protein [Calocera viscosa TUFC12733]